MSLVENRAKIVTIPSNNPLNAKAGKIMTFSYISLFDKESRFFESE